MPSKPKTQKHIDYILELCSKLTKEFNIINNKKSIKRNSSHNNTVMATIKNNLIKLSKTKKS